MSDEARDSFRKCRAALENAEAHFLPFAAVESFPSLGDACSVVYADAAGEGQFEGMGFWMVSGNTCFLYMDEWAPDENLIPIHAREAYISTAGVMTAHVLFPHHTWCLEYTDNTPTEAVHESQSSQCELLQTIILARADFFDTSGTCAVTQRVCSKHNVWADHLSRGQWQLVIAACLELGLRPVWIDVPKVATVLRAALRAQSLERELKAK